MKHHVLNRNVVAAMLILMLFQGCATLAAADVGGEETSVRCTVFTVSKGDQVFFGGNDDYINPDSYSWVDPGGAKGYGAIWIGTPDNVQQGVNEKGLAYDANGLPRVDVNPHPERQFVAGDYTSYPVQILRECATVGEVIAWVKAHQWHSYMHDQMQFADATGDAVIISAGADGEVVFTRKPQGDGYLVSTNFNVANPANGYGYPCSRYQTAQKWLGRLVNRAGELTAQDAASVLDAVHVEGASWTIESLVADLPNGIVYLYYFHQFDRPVVLNVAEEIARGRAGGPLSALFPEDVRQEAARRYQHIQAGRIPGAAAGFRHKERLSPHAPATAAAYLGRCQPGDGRDLRTCDTAGKQERPAATAALDRGGLVGMHRRELAGRATSAPALRGLERAPRLSGVARPCPGGR